jgi:hypothetical protein
MIDKNMLQQLYLIVHIQQFFVFVEVLYEQKQLQVHLLLYQLNQVEIYYVDHVHE